MVGRDERAMRKHNFRLGLLQEQEKTLATTFHTLASSQKHHVSGLKWQEGAVI